MCQNTNMSASQFMKLPSLQPSSEQNALPPLRSLAAGLFPTRLMSENSLSMQHNSSAFLDSYSLSRGSLSPPMSQGLESIGRRSLPSLPTFSFGDVRNNSLTSTSSRASSLSGDDVESTPSVPNSPGSIHAPGSISSLRGKRRQRSGPSCDACRVRKVKCDAEIIISDYQDLSIDEKLMFDKNTQDNQTFQLSNGFTILKTLVNIKSSRDEKYIKYRSCTACNNRTLKCCFSKGFTRNDIVKYNKFKSESSDEECSVAKRAKTAQTTPPPSTNFDSSSSSLSPKSTLTAPSSVTPPLLPARRSSCLNCRSKKIKCARLEDSERCTHCDKKDLCCSFE